MTPLHRHIEVPNELDQVRVLQAAVEELCEPVLAPGRLFKLSMAIEELATNVTMHARNSPVIGLDVSVGPRAVAVELSDEGGPFNPLEEAPAPTLAGSIEERPVGGLGVHLVKTMVDRVGYRRAGRRNLVRLEMDREASAL